MSIQKARELAGKGPVDVAGRRGGVRHTSGYSLLELQRAGISLERAEELSLCIDVERKTGVGVNVIELRTLNQG